MPVQAPKGTRDILPEDINKWNFVEEEFSDICRRFGYNEIQSFFSAELGILPI
jgi:histidyl-tRNA synthetase